MYILTIRLDSSPIFVALIATLFPLYECKTKNDESTGEPAECTPPPDRFDVHRLGKTRFYALHNTKNNRLGYEDAFKACQKLGLRLAQVDRITTDAMISRLLEIKVTNNTWKDTWYWIDAEFDKNLMSYRHRDSKKVIEYSNFFLRHPRPLGVGGHVNWQDKYKTTTDQNQCITIALPYKHPSDTYGFQTSWDERACESSTHRRALCESTNPACDFKTQNPEYFVDNDSTQRYFDEGNFIFAERRFIVNWKPRTMNESKAYCEQWGLQMFRPALGDACLIPYLKFVAEQVSTYQFWTPLSYKNGDGFYLGNRKVSNESLHMFDTRSSKMDSKFCVAATWTYEYSNATACKGCMWNSVILTPANCLNHVGTICQHQNPKLFPCDWKLVYSANPMLALKEKAVVPFGNRFTSVWRSTYKQTFGNRICGAGNRKMVNIGWELPFKVNEIKFEYDIEEDYWVVDENEFKHSGKPGEKCTVGKFRQYDDIYVMDTRKVSCTEWHFYLCYLVS